MISNHHNHVPRLTSSNIFKKGERRKMRKRIISTNLFLLILSFVNPLYSFGSEQIMANKKAFSPNGAHYLYFKVSQEDVAKILVYNDRLKKTFTIVETPLRYQSLNYKWFNDDLLEINIWTGSPGNYSIFYSVDNNKISEEQYFPLAVDPRRYLVLLGQEDVYITGIFDTKHSYKLDLNFQKTAIKFQIFDLERTYFDKSGNLLFRYQDADGRWVTGRLEKDMIKLQ